MFKSWKRQTVDQDMVNALREELTKSNKWKEISLAPSTPFLMNVLRDTIKNAESQWNAALTTKMDTDLAVFRAAVLAKVNTLKALIREIEEAPARCLNIEQELSKITPPEEGERGEQ